MSSIYDWSLSAAMNANADDIINWAEGQPPSSVNNSARAMMQRMREYIEDLSGNLQAEGSENALRLQTNTKFLKYQNGLHFSFRAKSDNSAAVTLDINTIGPKPVFKASFDGVVQLTGGEIRAAGIYEVIYNENLANNNGGWFLKTLSQIEAQPVGMIAPFAMPIAPNGWLACDGAAVSRNSYAKLFAAIGTSWGAGDGHSTFNVPDFRGMFLRGFDNGRGIDSGRNFASYQDSDNKSHSHSAYCSEAGAHSHNYTVLDFAYPGPNGTNSWSWFKWATKRTDMDGNHSHTISIESSGVGESRPVNMSIFYAIKV